MNSTFSLDNDDDLSAYNLGIGVCSEQQIHGMRYGKPSEDKELAIYFEPNLHTIKIDPTTKQHIDDEIDLQIEPYFITITTHTINFKSERRKTKFKNINDQDQLEVISIDTSEDILFSEKPTATSNEEVKRSKPRVKVTKPTIFPDKTAVPDETAVNLERKIFHPSRLSEPLIPVRLKSGENVKIPKTVFNRLKHLSLTADLSKNCVLSSRGIEIQSVSQPNIVHVPFTDRLSGALGRLNNDHSHNKTNSKPVIHNGKNGKICKTVKLRAALDKSTIAWASTTRLKPKTNLLDHLKVLSTAAQDPFSKRKFIPSVRKPSASKAPVVIKLMAKHRERNTTTLSNALKKIACDGIVTNGFTTK